MSDTSSAATPSLARRLGLGDAVVIGLGSMIGAGVFAVWAPAARTAGPWLVLGLLIALVVAYCNATSSAQLAAQYPTSGGTYVYGRERLGEWPGFLAGWGFVVGKTASIAAMALTFGDYLLAALGELSAPVARASADPGTARLLTAIPAVAAVAGLTAVNCRGVTRTARLTRGIVTVVLGVLVVALAAAWLRTPTPLTGAGAGPEAPEAVGPYQVLQSAGLLFFAFAGYARIATMGEEVREPRRTIPRAIVAALAIVAVVYLVVGLSLLRIAPVDAIARAGAPLTLLVGADPLLVVLVTLAAATATAGAMLNLMTGVGRTALAMARNRDLPTGLAAIDPTYQVPRRAELVLAAVVIVLVLVADLRTVIGFSSFGVLCYYFVANCAAYTQEAGHRRYPRPLQVLGALLCALLVVTLPWPSILVGVGVYAVGALYRLIARNNSAARRA